jgi:hypothetical protein
LYLTLSEVAEDSTIAGTRIDPKQDSPMEIEGVTRSCIADENLPCLPYRNAREGSIAQPALHRIAKIAQDSTVAGLGVDYKQCPTWKIKLTTSRSSILVNHQDIASLNFGLDGTGSAQQPPAEPETTEQETQNRTPNFMNST